MRSRKLCRLLVLMLIVVDEVRGVVEVDGAGGSMPSGLYMAWMAAFRSSRRPFVDVRLSYKAQDSGFGKQAIISRSVDYAGSDSLMSDAQYEQNPDLQMFPAAALSVSCYAYYF